MISAVVTCFITVIFIDFAFSVLQALADAVKIRLKVK